MIQVCTINQHLGALVGKIPSQQVSGLDFKSQTTSCVLVLLILHFHPKQLTKKKKLVPHTDWKYGVSPESG